MQIYIIFRPKAQEAKKTTLPFWALYVTFKKIFYIKSEGSEMKYKLITN